MRAIIFLMASLLGEGETSIRATTESHSQFLRSTKPRTPLSPSLSDSIDRWGGHGMPLADQNLTEIESICQENPGLPFCHPGHLPDFVLLIGFRACSYFSNGSVWVFRGASWFKAKRWKVLLDHQPVQAFSYLADWTEREAAFKTIVST